MHLCILPEYLFSLSFSPFPRGASTYESSRTLCYLGANPIRLGFRKFTYQISFLLLYNSHSRFLYFIQAQDNHGELVRQLANHPNQVAIFPALTPSKINPPTLPEAHSFESEVGLHAANEALKSELLTLQKKMSTLLRSRDETILRAESIFAKLSTCQTQL